MPGILGGEGAIFGLCDGTYDCNGQTQDQKCGD